jgi:multidrug efflux pump subunit AcrA (membrane-fusion protein)
MSRGTARKILIGTAVAVGLLAIAAGIVFLPIKFPSTVGSYADITAAHEWTLATGSTGQLIANTSNYRTGVSDGYRVTSFDGGSSVFFTLRPSLRPGQRIAAGDTIGVVTSTEMQEHLVSLNGQLAAAERSLAATAAGAKSEVIAAAEQRLESAKRRREDYKPTVERTQSLFDDHLIPQAEFDRVQTAGHALDDAVAINEADLATARSGAKPEELALAETHIETLKNEIAAANAQAAGYTIRSPIDGILSSNATGSTLVRISASSPYVALIPVRWSDYARVSATPDAPLTIGGFSRPIRGRIVALEHEVSTRASQKVVMATALLDDPPLDLLPGSVARCRIDCRSMTALEYVQFILHAIATSVEGTSN